MRIEGQVQVGEASAYAAAACAPLRGGPHPFVVLLLLASVLFCGAYAVLIAADILFDLPSWVAVLAPYVIGLGAFLFAWNLTHRFTARRRLKAHLDRGLVSPFASALEITDAGLTVFVGRIRTDAPWPAVSDLLLAGPYWIILVEGFPHFLPKRFFASAQDEKAFISDILARMSPEAQARSVNAKASVGA